MRYDRIPLELFKKNRAKFTSKMYPNSIAVFNSNDVYPIGADSTFPFQQSRDLFYLSGIDQEESILLLFPNALKESHKEILFLRETNEKIAIWEGEKLTKEEAIKVSGIKTIYWLLDFERVFFDLMTEAQGIYFNTNEHYRQQVETQTREDRFIIWCKSKFMAHRYHRSNPILQKIRGIKEKEEIELLQRACNITEKGFRRVLDFIKPNVWEYEIEAEFLYTFVSNRSKGFAYTPIIASGNNSNVLHYITNNNKCLDGELVLMDVGAEYANYSSDMTRVLPVNGKFSKRQKEVYNSVLTVMKEAISMLRPGILWHEHKEEVSKIMTLELLKLKLLDKVDIANQTKDRPAYLRYFMHGVSHHLGLDTHDYGDLKNPLQENTVLTVEPGIYIPEEKIGIRLEDNVVIQKNDVPLNLMKSIPIEIDEIEILMNK